MFTQLLATSVGVSLLLSRFAPQYSLGATLTALLLFFVSFTAYQFWRIIIYTRFFSPIRNVPTPPDAKFFTGSTKNIVNGYPCRPQREWMEAVPNNGLIRYSHWFQERLLITNTKALGEVLVTKNYDFIKPPQLAKTIGRILGLGILFAEGDEHKLQRKNLMPAFAYRHIKDLHAVFWAKAREMTEVAKADLRSSSEQTNEPSSNSPAVTDGVEQHAPGAIEVGDYFSRATLDIIGLSGMGQDFNSLQDRNNKLNRTYRMIFSPTKVGFALQIVGVFLPFWFVSRIPLQRNKDFNEASIYIKDVCRDMIAKKRAAIQEKGRSDVDIISVALESGGFTDDELVNQMMTFLVAGHETTATSMIWAMCSLCQHPEVQRKLRDEVRSKLPSPDSPITAADIDSCQYLRAVCNEVLRLHAPVSMTLRSAACDTSINGQFVPKGTTIILPPWAINTSTESWGPDALEFKPERWLDADGKANNKGGAESNFSFLTFLHGPRSCIGQKFAQAEFECLLAAWVGRFETTFEEGGAFARGEEPEIKGGVTSKPRGGLWVHLKEVDGW